MSVVSNSAMQFLVDALSLCSNVLLNTIVTGFVTGKEKTH